jgi:hypothetical protein
MSILQLTRPVAVTNYTSYCQILDDTQVFTNLITIILG